jgi:hypothetical protein
VHGKRFYFDHEEASWLIQAGSDIIVEFPWILTLFIEIEHKELW